MVGDLRWAGGWRNPASVLVAVLCAAPLFGLGASAEPRRKAPDTAGATAARVNSNTVYIVSGNLDGTYLPIAHDLASVLDDGDDFRVLPVIGKGAGRNIRDVRFMKGVDIGITQANLLDLFRTTKEIGSIQDRIVYIARLFNEEMHVVVRADSGIKSIDGLSGRKVNFGDAGGGAHLATREIFGRLGIEATEVNMRQGEALEALKTRAIDATVLIAGKPAMSTARLSAAEGFRLLPVPFAKPLQDEYLPAALSHADYPNLIERGRTVDTIAVGAVLIAHDGPAQSDRYRRIAKFVQAFFPRLPELQGPPHHPKWREVNLAATLPGWKRFPAADEWLRRNQPSQAQVKGRPEAGSAGGGKAAPAKSQESLLQGLFNADRAQETR
jgi:uncharacterized protein